MIDVHYWPTPNGKKITIQLEESGIEYNVVECSIGQGAQFCVVPNSQNAEYL